MLRISGRSWLLPAGALTLFGATAADTASRFALLSDPVSWGLLAAALALALLAALRPHLARTRAGILPLLLAALAALAARTSLTGGVSVGPESAIRAADRVEAWLADRTREIGDAAYQLARTPNLAAALEGSDAVDYRAQAFRVLAAWPLPASAAGASSATLHDRRLRPVAWSGTGADLGTALGEIFPEGIRAEDCPDPSVPLFVYAESASRSHLVAADCVRNLLGLVTVELPLTQASPPSSGNAPISGIQAAAGRGLTVQIHQGADELEPLAGLLERRGERFVEGPEDAVQYYFALRAYDGQLLGVASTPISPLPARRAERRAEASLIAALALLAGGLAAGAFLWGLGLAGALAAVGVVRFGFAALTATLPPGFAGVLDAPPAPGLPSPLPGFLDSPPATLLSALALFLAVRLLEPRLRRTSAQGERARGRGLLRGAAAGAVLGSALWLVQGAGRTGASPLSPTWRVDIGWPQILGWTAMLVALAALLLLTAALLRPARWSSPAAAAVLAAAAAIRGDPQILLAALPLAAAIGLNGTRRGRLALHALRRPLLDHEPGFSFFLTFGLFLAAPLLWYPAMHRQEEAARSRYAEEAAPVLALRNRFSICHALGEAARNLERNASELEPIRADTAYRLWARTGLARLTSASALEIVGTGGVVSRFGVGLPRRPDPLSSDPAGPDWSPVPACADAAGPGAETTLETRRRFASGHIVTLRAVDRVREIPFLPRAAGIADHFLVRGGAAPAIFGNRDLRLEASPAAAGTAAGGARPAVRIEADDRAYTVSWRATGAGDHASNLLGWGFLAAVTALLLAGAARVRLLFPGLRRRLRRRSLQMQLTEALAAAVLVAILGLAVFVQDRLGTLLLTASDAQAQSRSRALERVAAEAGALDPAELPAELGFRLAQVADQLDTDAALYQQGSLLAVSRPELALTGLLPPRPPPPAALAADRGEPVLSVHEAGSLRYRIIWTPLAPTAPGVPRPLLAVPLPADEAARIEGVRALQRTLVLGSVALTIAFAVLLPGFVARRLAAPVRGLARATGRIADGFLETEVPLDRAPAEVRLLAAGVERLVRRIPSVRRRMREEAAADLTRRVAHDIKNALAPIAIEADTIRRILREPRGRPREREREVNESVRDILGQVERLRRISSEFSAVGAPLRLEEVDAGALVRKTTGPYLRARIGPRVRLSAPATPARINADPEIVARIVENLLRNAVEALGDLPPEEGAPGRGTISVRVLAHEEGPHLRIEIEDDGPGVAEELRERIFDAAFSTRTRGSGLGLANARRFAEAHGGTLRARPRKDGRRGLRFVLDLPVAGPEGETGA